jgi:hypothetical protein
MCALPAIVSWDARPVALAGDGASVGAGDGVEGGLIGVEDAVAVSPVAVGVKGIGVGVATVGFGLEMGVDDALGSGVDGVGEALAVAMADGMIFEAIEAE